MRGCSLLEKKGKKNKIHHSAISEEEKKYQMTRSLACDARGSHAETGNRKKKVVSHVKSSTLISLTCALSTVVE
jgi:hypothetical protein